MPYTDYNQVLHDLANNIRECNGSTASIRFVDMPDLIDSFLSLSISLAGEYMDQARSWKYKLAPYADTSGMTDMHDMFKEVNSYLDRVLDLDLSNFDTSNVTTMAYMFYEAKLHSLDLSSFDTSNVTDMSYMFYGIHGTPLDLSNFDTSNVQTMESMFQDSRCTDLDLSNFDTSNVTTTHNMFHYFKCFNNLYLDLSNWDVSNSQDLKNMFSCLGCSTSSTSIHPIPWGGTITLNVTGWKLPSRSGKLESCFQNAGITKLDLSGWNTSGVNNMKNLLTNAYITKMWVPSTFVATDCSSGYKPFEYGTLHTCDVYTDATDATTQGWGTINSKFTMHYNSIHADYENA